MWTQKVFFNSLLISILVHGIIILQAPKFNISVKNKKAEKIEIRYINIPKTEKRIDKRQETDTSLRDSQQAFTKGCKMKTITDHQARAPRLVFTGSDGFGMDEQVMQATRTG